MEFAIPSAAHIGAFAAAGLLAAARSRSGRPVHRRPQRRARAAGGVVSVLGITTGTLVHVTAAVVGLSALITSSVLGVLDRQVCRRRLSHLYRRAASAESRRPAGRSLATCRGAVCGACTATASSSTCSIRRRRCSSWPSCRNGSMPPRAAYLPDRLSRPAVRGHGPVQRRDLCAAGGDRGELDAAASGFPEGRALRHRWRVHRPGLTAAIAGNGRK